MHNVTTHTDSEFNTDFNKTKHMACDKGHMTSGVMWRNPSTSQGTQLDVNQARAILQVHLTWGQLSSGRLHVEILVLYMQTGRITLFMQDTLNNPYARPC